MIGNLIIGGGSGATIDDPLGVGDGGTGTTTEFTPGSIVFAGASGVYSQDNANLFWNDTDNHLGIGSNSPLYSLYVGGGGLAWFGGGSIAGGFTRINNAAGLAAGAATVTVDDTTGFPTKGIFRINGELISYTGKTATTFTGLDRGKFSTTDTAHNDNDPVVQVAFVSGRDATSANSIIATLTGQLYVNAGGVLFELPSSTSLANLKVGGRFTVGDTWGVVYGTGTTNAFFGVGGPGVYFGSASNHDISFRINNSARLFLSTGNLLQFELQTSSAPALKRSSTTLQVRLADDSAFAPLSTGALTVNTQGGNVDWNTFTPTRSAETNLDSNVTMTEAQWMRVGNTITVSGRFTADPTTTVTATSFEMTLPVASNIGAAEDAAGVAFCGAIAGQGAAITGSVANNTAVVSWIAGDVTSQTWSYIFTYQVI